MEKIKDILSGIIIAVRSFDEKHVQPGVNKVIEKNPKLAGVLKPQVYYPVVLVIIVVIIMAIAGSGKKDAGSVSAKDSAEKTTAAVEAPVEESNAEVKETASSSGRRRKVTTRPGFNGYYEAQDGANSIWAMLITSEDKGKYQVEIARFIDGNKDTTYRCSGALNTSGDMVLTDLDVEKLDDGVLVYLTDQFIRWNGYKQVMFTRVEGKEDLLSLNDLHYLYADPNAMKAPAKKTASSTSEVVKNSSSSSEAVKSSSSSSEAVKSSSSSSEAKKSSSSSSEAVKSSSSSSEVKKSSSSSSEAKKSSSSSSEEKKSSSSSSEEKDPVLYQVKINGFDGFVNLRSKGGMDGKVLQEISNGAVVDVYGAKGKWLYVEYNGTMGYIAASQTVKQ